MKKLTAGIFTVLMGLVSVNAADAAVASKGYVDQQVKVNADAISAMDTAYKAADTGLDTRLQAVEALNGTGAGSVSAQISALETSLKEYADTAESDAVTAAKSYTDTTVAGLDADQVGTDGSYIKLVSQADGKVSATAASFEGNVADDSTSVNAPTTAAVATYVKGKLEFVTGDEGIAGLQSQIDEINDSDVMKSGVDADAVAQVATNKADIAAINDAENGILAQAKADATSKADAAQAAAISAAGTAAEGQITAAVGALDVDEVTATDGNYFNAYAETDGKISMKQKTFEATLADNVKNAPQTGAVKSYVDSAITDMATQDYVVAKANAALDASVGYTDAVVDGLKLADIARVPAACSEKTKYCALTTDGTNFIWEVIERATGETIEGAPVVVPDVATVSKPAAIAK